MRITDLPLRGGVVAQQAAIEIKDLTLSFYHGIAYMLARDSLLPWHTALENAAYGMEIRGVAAEQRRAVIFSGLRLGLIYALLGVIAGEILAAEHGLGQQLAFPLRPSTWTA